MTKPRPLVVAIELEGEAEGVGDCEGTTLESAIVTPLLLTEPSEVKRRVTEVPLEEGSTVEVDWEPEPENRTGEEVLGPSKI
jgi:hypothetical protein